MQPMATDGVVWSVCLLIMFVSPTKTAEQIKMAFEKVTQMGPRNHILDGAETGQIL